MLRDKILRKIGSRKFIMAFFSSTLILLNDGLGLNLDSTSIGSFAGIIITYILGQSHVDGKEELGKKAQGLINRVVDSVGDKK